MLQVAYSPNKAQAFSAGENCIELDHALSTRLWRWRVKKAVQAAPHAGAAQAEAAPLARPMTGRRLRSRTPHPRRHQQLQRHSCAAHPQTDLC